MQPIKYFVRVEGSIKTVFGFSNKRVARQFFKNMDLMLRDGYAKGLLDFGTIKDGFLEFAYNPDRHGEIVDMRSANI